MTKERVRKLQYKYSPTPTVRRMHEFLQKYWGELNLPLIIGCLGPPESGKSVGVIQMLNMVKWAMPEVIDNETGERMRHSKIGICRDTVKQIRDGPYATMKQGWFPVEFGRINNATSGSNAPISGTLKIPKMDGSTCQVELEGIIFGDNVEDAKDRLKSVEFTCVYANEIQGLPPDVLSLLMERVGRYPSGDRGMSKAKLVIVDYNMPPEGAWCEKLHERNAVYTEKTPRGYIIRDDFTLLGFNVETQEHDVEVNKHLDDVISEGVVYIQYIFVQPPAAFKNLVGLDRNGKEVYEYVANPGAEVPPHGRGSPYPTLVAQGVNRGQERDVERELCMLPVDSADGMPVYGGQFRTANSVLTPYFPPNSELFTLVGSDTSGNNPAMLFYQLTEWGWIQVKEMCEVGGTFKGLLDKLDAVTGDTPSAEAEFSKDRMLIVCDPANAKDSWTGLNPVQHLRSRGYYAIPANTNRTERRIDNARERLTAGHVKPIPKLVGGVAPDAKPEAVVPERYLPDRVWFSATCVMTVAALKKEHKYKRVAGQEHGIYHLKPDKNTNYSHYADSYEYAMLGLTELLREDSIKSTMDSIRRFRATQGVTLRIGIA